MTHRDGDEDGKARFRSVRFYSVEDKHYFSTREGSEVGPFTTKQDAEEGLVRYINALEDNNNHKLAESAALHGSWASTHFQ
ncbi:MAG: DUF6316 family protein [Agarilytica sp.]